MIEPRYSVLQALFADRVFRIPHYQRFYSWHKRQRDDLFNDLRTLAARGDDQHHFMATIVCHRTNETTSIGASQYRLYDVVDGQQRLTTLIVLLKCIELEMPADSEDRKDLAKILVKRDGHLILLQTNNVNEYIFNGLLREGLAPQDADLQTHSDHSLQAAIRHCTQFVREWKRTADLTSLMSLLLHRLGFVVYDTEDNRVVYTVFEVLNSRGLAVDWLDKTKSILMGRSYELSSSVAVAEAEIQGLQSIWGQIYREIAKANVAGDEILRVTATLYYSPGVAKPRPAEECLGFVRKECNQFGKPRAVSERLLDVARKLVKLHGTHHLRPVTEILHARLLAVAIMGANGITDPERKMLLEQWERVTFRIFGLFSKDSRTKVGDYVRMAAKIVAEDLEMRTYNQIMGGLHLLGADYPIDGAVAEGLIEKNCYERSPETCRYILWLYEEHLAETLGCAATIDEQERSEIWSRRAVDSVEHIFPQNPGPNSPWRNQMHRSGGAEEPLVRHVGRIGNLILLPTVVNQEATNRPFQEKKELYARHNLRMVQEVCTTKMWTIEQIEEREKRIVEWAKTRWCDK